MKIDETAASWDRIKVSLGPTSRPQTLAEAANLGPLKSMKSYEILVNTYKSIKMHEIHEIL